jgi:16S rRNA pseudouridine516 synthase
LDGEQKRDPSARVVAGPDLSERMQIAGAPVDPPPPLTVLLNKPIGVVCSHREAGRSVYELLPTRWRRRTPVLSTIGRLDADTSGLLLITDDGALLHRVISPKRHVRKTYLAALDHDLGGAEGSLFASGTLMLEGETKPLAPAILAPVSPRLARLTVTEGRYHQVRRMFAAAGNHVSTLHRESIGGLELPADLEEGAWRIATTAEIDRVFSADKA